MRILEINKFNHIRGGADRHFVDLVKLLQSNGNEVAVFAMEHPENKYSEWSGYFVSRVEYEKKTSLCNKIKAVARIFWSLEARRKISKMLDEFQPDIVHIHNIYHQISPSILGEIKKRNIPIVMTVHDWKLVCPNYLLTCNGKFCRRCLKGSYWHCLRNKCVKNSYAKSLVCALEMYLHRWLNVYDSNIDFYIAPSKFVKNILVRAGLSEKKIKVIHNFVCENKTPEGFHKNRDAVGTGPRALYIGKISKEKGVNELIGIFKGLPIDLILAGNKDEKFEIPNLPNIKYAGFRPSREINELIRESDFVVSASRLPETFGLIALEAVSNGKPFVGYRTGAYSEVIKDGRNGFLVNTKDEMTEKIKRVLSGGGEKFDFNTEKFSAEKYYQRIERLFEDLTAR